MVNYGKIASAAWFAFPMPLQYGIDFVPGAIILMLFMSLLQQLKQLET
jgi:xanthine/uracil permease